MADAQGYVRLFVDEGTAMQSLLRRAATSSSMTGCVGRLLAAFPGASPA
ncbi:MAG: hypothetical protein ACE5FD_00375 [Anaerolineae bacterium]